MVTGFCRRSRQPPTWFEMRHAILRNFGGLQGDVAPIQTFDNIITNIDKEAIALPTDPDCSPAGLIRTSLLGGRDRGGEEENVESRYMLILTEAYAALGILQQHMHEMGDAITIFGSSFPKDQEYTQVCSLVLLLCLSLSFSLFRSLPVSLRNNCFITVFILLSFWSSQDIKLPFFQCIQRKEPLAPIIDRFEPKYFYLQNIVYLDQPLPARSLSLKVPTKFESA